MDISFEKELTIITSDGVHTMESNEVEKSGRQRAVNGRAHEHIALGILMKKYHNVFLSDLTLATYDMVIALQKENGTEEIIRAQVKTAQTSVNFTGGTRGGVDREYKSGVKEYVQSTKTSDIVIGVHPIENGFYELYFVPTILIEELGQKSISLNRIKELRNNYEILEKCKDYDFIIRKCTEYGIIKNK